MNNQNNKNINVLFSQSHAEKLTIDKKEADETDAPTNEANFSSLNQLLTDPSIPSIRF